MRILGANVTNTLLVEDNLSGGELEVYYRMPTSAEQIAYTNESLVRSGDDVQIRRGESRLKFGMQILTGIREGDFGVLVDGQVVALSSDPASTAYREDWRDLFLEHGGSDIVNLLAARVFEMPVMAKRQGVSVSGNSHGTAPPSLKGSAAGPRKKSAK